MSPFCRFNSLYLYVWEKAKKAGWPLPTLRSPNADIARYGNLGILLYLVLLAWSFPATDRHSRTGG